MKFDRDECRKAQQNSDFFTLVDLVPIHTGILKEISLTINGGLT